MVINWFPGHMTKALRTMQKEIKNIDCVVYVVDARAPFACLNPEFDKLIAGKATLVAVNKIDLCDKDKLLPVLPKLKNHFGENADIITLDSTTSGSGKKIFEKIENLCKDKIEKNKVKGINTFIRAMVIGVPNCGKSTLINNLCGKAKTITGDKAGVTRGKQWVTVSKNVQIMDTPGTLYPNLGNEKTAKYLAYIGSIKNEVLDFSELALEFVRDISSQYPEALPNRYGIEEVPEGLDNFEIAGVLEQIAENRHFVTKGGEVDYERVALTVLDDFKKARLGKITLL